MPRPSSLIRLCTLLVLLAGVGLVGACESRPAAPKPVSAATTTVASSALPRAAAAPSATATAPALPLPPPLAYGGEGPAAKSPHGMVSSEDAHATRAGVTVLEAGGNAVDAAVAVAYALSVTHHSAGSLGGGGFMVIHFADGRRTTIDYREAAPAAATEAKNQKQLNDGAHGYLSAAVPGVVAGLELAREKYGSLPRADLVAPAIALARDGHPYGGRQSLVLAWYWDRLKKDPTLKAVLGRGDKPVGRGKRLKQRSLAKTLEAIAKDGRAGFYEGEVGQLIAKAMTNKGGLVTEEDLSAYRAKEREPLAFRYRDYEVLTMPPPSMGGVALYAMTQHLAAQEVTPDVQSADGLHLFVEAARRAYADRRGIGADPDFADAEVLKVRRARFFDPAYFTDYKPPIGSKATDSKAITPLSRSPKGSPESPDTTHFAVVDRHGNAVSCTTTTSAAFGAWVMVPGTGVILSNVMGAFSPKGINALEPGKRPASSMTPTIIVRGGRPVAAIGSPGGDTIPTTVTQVLRNLIDGHMTIDAAIEAPRVHHQYLPDQVRVEKKRMLKASVIADLMKRGHEIQKNPIDLGDANGVSYDHDGGMAYGFTDTRKGGLALGPSEAPAKMDP